MSSVETPPALRALLAARADPNLCTCKEDTPVPLLPEIRSERIAHGLDPEPSKLPCTILTRVIALARDEHVMEMYNALVEYGAETNDLYEERLQNRLDSIKTEAAWMRAFHR